MSPLRLDPATVRRQLLALDQALAHHLAASSGHDVTDYASSIDHLGALGVVPVALARELRPLAGFRNALVHGYLQIDVARVHAVLNHHLDQLRDFAQHIESHLSSVP